VAAAHGAGLLAIEAVNPYAVQHSADAEAPYSSAQVTDMYDRATLSGGHHAKHSHCDSTVALRAHVATELHLHIARMPSALGLSVSTIRLHVFSGDHLDS